MGAAGAGEDVIAGLLAGGTLRGVVDANLADIPTPVAVVPSDPPNPAHQRHTVASLTRLIPHAVELPGCPEPPRPEFPARLPALLGSVARFARGAGDRPDGRRPVGLAPVDGEDIEGRRRRLRGGPGRPR